jgi:hypothetical protein
MKNRIKSIALTALLVAGACQTSIMHAHPLEKLMPFVTRILWNSKSYLEYAPGLWIKKLAEPYGLTCQYPVLVKKKEQDPNAPSSNYAAYAKSDQRETGAQPKLDTLGRVILDPNDKDLFTTDNPRIVFKYDFVKRNQDERKYLAAVLFHENKHLEENHIGQKTTLNHQISYAQKKREKDRTVYIDNDMALTNGLPVSSGDVYQTIIPGLNLLCEEEADTSFKKHPELCRGRAPVYLTACFKSDLKNFRALEVQEDADGVMRFKNTGPVKDKKIFELYRKACLGDRAAYEYLEQTYQLSHPLSVRRRNYYLQWANEAEKNQTKKHPNLNDAWLDYCTRHIAKLDQTKEQQ